MKFKNYTFNKVISKNNYKLNQFNKCKQKQKLIILFKSNRWKQIDKNLKIERKVIMSKCLNCLI